MGYFRKRDVKHRMKWREASGVLCEKRIPTNLKGKFYRSVMGTTMLYDSWCQLVDRKIEESISVTETKMLRWTSGMTKEGKLRNKYVRGSCLNSG